jgi:hypothetical protein
LATNADDYRVMNLIRSAFAQEDSWASADTIIAGQLVIQNCLSTKGRNWFEDKMDSGMGLRRLVRLLREFLTRLGIR